MDHLDQLQAIQEDMLDLALAAARMLTTDEERHSLDDVLAQFGYGREQIRGLPE